MIQSKLCPAIAGVAMVAGLVSCLWSSSAFAGVTPEAYGFADAQAHDVLDEGPLAVGPSFSETGSAVSNPLGHAQPDASAAASAYGESFGPFGVAVSIAGHANNPNAAGRNDINATASSANSVQYVVTSGSLNPGDPVRARLTLNFKGSIETTDGNPAVPDESGLYAYIFTDTQIGHNGQPMDIIHEGGADFDVTGQFVWGDFEGHEVFTHDAAAGRHAATFDFTDTVEFDTAVGSTVELSFNYWADAKAELPLNVSANVDFSAGTTYSLAAANASDGAQFVAVPEPAGALSLAGISAAGALLRRSRRRSCRECT